MNEFKYMFKQPIKFGKYELTHKRTGIIAGIFIHYAFLCSVISFATLHYLYGILFILYGLLICYPISYYNMEEYRNEVKYAKRT